MLDLTVQDSSLVGFRSVLGLLCINTALRLGVFWRGSIVSVYRVGVGIASGNYRLTWFEGCDHRPS